MNFKYDTTKNKTIILPEYHLLDDKLAEALLVEIKKLQKSDHNNIIINLENITSSETEARNKLLDLHRQVYENGGSIVFIGINDDLLKMIKKDQLHLNINITTSLVDAKEIINSEIQEREIINEL